MRNRNAKQNLEHENANVGTRKKNFEKARGTMEREEEMKERSHKGPAGTLAQLWKKGCTSHGTVFLKQ